MSAKTQLSFCIPVFNFGAFLPETIESIRSQITDSMEIIVLDGGSTDGTSTTMTRLCGMDSRVRYVRQDAPGGIDADLATCIEAARGEYCWLFSGDDLLRPAAVDYVVQALKNPADVYLLTHTNCTVTMQFVGIHRVARVSEPWRLDLGLDSDRRAWLTRACNSEALFSFISTIVVRRDAWHSVCARSDFDRSCWAHVARLLEVAKRSLIVEYHPCPLVDRRGENDSFRDRGIVRRLAIAVDGFNRLAKEFARNGFEYEQIRRLVRADLPIRFFIGAKVACLRNPERESKAELDRLVMLCYEAAGMLNRLKILLYRFFPPLLVPLTRRLLVLLRSRSKAS